MRNPGQAHAPPCPTAHELDPGLGGRAQEVGTAIYLLELSGLCGRANTVLEYAMLMMPAVTVTVRQVPETKRCNLKETEDALDDRTAPMAAAPEGAP